MRFRVFGIRGYISVSFLVLVGLAYVGIKAYNKYYLNPMKEKLRETGMLTEVRIINEQNGRFYNYWFQTIEGDTIRMTYNINPKGSSSGLKLYKGKCVYYDQIDPNNWVVCECPF